MLLIFSTIFINKYIKKIKIIILENLLKKYYNYNFFIYFIFKNYNII